MMVTAMETESIIEASREQTTELKQLIKEWDNKKSQDFLAYLKKMNTESGIKKIITQEFEDFIQLTQLILSDTANPLQLNEYKAIGSELFYFASAIIFQQGWSNRNSTYSQEQYDNAKIKLYSASIQCYNKYLQNVDDIAEAEKTVSTIKQIYGELFKVATQIKNFTTQCLSEIVSAFPTDVYELYRHFFVKKKTDSKSNIIVDTYKLFSEKSSASVAYEKPNSNHELALSIAARLNVERKKQASSTKKFIQITLPWIKKLDNKALPYLDQYYNTYVDIMEKSDSNNQDFKIASELLLIAEFYKSKLNFQRSIAYREKLATVYRLQGHDQKAAICYQTIHDIYLFDLKNLKKAEEYAAKLDIYQKKINLGKATKKIVIAIDSFKIDFSELVKNTSKVISDLKLAVLKTSITPPEANKQLEKCLDNLLQNKMISTDKKLYGNILHVLLAEKDKRGFCSLGNSYAQAESDIEHLQMMLSHYSFVGEADSNLFKDYFDTYFEKAHRFIQSKLRSKAKDSELVDIVKKSSKLLKNSVKFLSSVDPAKADEIRKEYDLKLLYNDAKVESDEQNLKSLCDLLKKKQPSFKQLLQKIVALNSLVVLDQNMDSVYNSLYFLARHTAVNDLKKLNESLSNYRFSRNIMLLELLTQSDEFKNLNGLSAYKHFSNPTHVNLSLTLIQSLKRSINKVLIEKDEHHEQKANLYLKNTAFASQEELNELTKKHMPDIYSIDLTEDTAYKILKKIEYITLLKEDSSEFNNNLNQLLELLDKHFEEKSIKLTDEAIINELNNILKPLDNNIAFNFYPKHFDMCSGKFSHLLYCLEAKLKNNGMPEFKEYNSTYFAQPFVKKHAQLVPLSKKLSKKLFKIDYVNGVNLPINPSDRLLKQIEYLSVLEENSADFHKQVEDIVACLEQYVESKQPEENKGRLGSGDIVDQLMELCKAWPLQARAVCRIKFEQVYPGRFPHLLFALKNSSTGDKYDMEKLSDYLAEYGSDYMHKEYAEEVSSSQLKLIPMEGSSPKKRPITTPCNRKKIHTEITDLIFST